MFGREAHDHRRGCRVVLFDKRTRRKLAKHLGPGIRSVERYLDPLAGFQYYAADMHWRQLRIQDPLSLVREPGQSP